MTITDTRKIVAIWRSGVRFDRDAYRARVAEATRVAALPVTIGPISDFEDAATTTRFGQGWEPSTDAMVGGTSTARLTITPGGAGGSKHALAIEGAVVAGKAEPWAGAMFSPGRSAFAPVDLSTKPRLRFLARGDGHPYVVLVFTKKGGVTPAMRPFTAGKDFRPVELAWTEFAGSDGSDVTGIFIGTVEPGPFRLAIDDVEVR